VATSLKPGRGGSTFLRVYQATGKATTAVKIRLNAKIASAQEANLMEDPGKKLETASETLRFDLGPFEIKTFALQLAKRQ
jgi:alpha-mannosidase